MAFRGHPLLEVAPGVELRWQAFTGWDLLPDGLEEDIASVTDLELALNGHETGPPETHDALARLESPRP